MTIKSFTGKQIIIIVVAALIIIGTIGIYFYKNVFKRPIDEDEYLGDYSEDELQIQQSNIFKEVEGEVEEKIIIHITGYVKNQGIVILRQGDRIKDAIDLAGGATEEADLNKINLAYELKDGEKVYVPCKSDSEEINYLSGGESNYVISSESGATNKENMPININTANRDQLKMLNGIGESMANKIIQYREENGKFGTIEDIKNVPGIGDSKFNGIKEHITVK